MAPASDIRSNVEALLPEIDARGAEIAGLRRLPGDLVESLKSAGAFRMPMPRSWGGPETSLREQVEIIEMLSRSDPSVGWCVMIGSDGGFYSAFFDDAVGRELWSDLDAVTAAIARSMSEAWSNTVLVGHGGRSAVAVAWVVRHPWPAGHPFTASTASSCPGLRRAPSRNAP